MAREILRSSPSHRQVAVPLRKTQEALLIAAGKTLTETQSGSRDVDSPAILNLPSNPVE
jgi:hypothetical protein